jgi:hypothetical protein
MFPRPRGLYDHAGAFGLILPNASERLWNGLESPRKATSRKATNHCKRSVVPTERSNAQCRTPNLFPSFDILVGITQVSV